MDVRCEQCNAEYDFDESLLGDKGTTVKCSTCGNVFRVLPRRGAVRPTLQLRYARSGQIEQLGSLRDLQSLIHAGVVTADDQLGRQGFPWRRLGDVPELKNFFVPKSADPTPNHKQLRVSPTSMPPDNQQPPGRPQGGRTVLGVGGPQPHIPGPPRVPNVASDGGVKPPVRTNGAPEQQGRAPTSDAPTASRARPDFGGSLGPSAPPRQDMASMSQAPTVPGLPPVDMRRSSPPAAESRRSNTPPLTAPTPSGNPVRLYLSEDEAPPARATADNSKIWVYAIVLLVLAGGGWLGINALAKKPPPESTLSRVEVPTPSPSLAPTPPGTEPAPGTTPAPAPQPGTTPTPAPAATAQPTPAPSEPSEPSEQPAATGSDKQPSGGSGGGGSSGKDPTDYGGWVAKGDKAFSKGDLAGARKAYESALALRGTGSEANSGLGFTLLGEGKAQEAIPYLDRAAGSGYAEANIGLGDAYRRLGQKAAALEAYKDYLSRLPSGSRASYVKKQMEALNGGGGGGEARPSGEQAPGEYRPAGEITAPEPAPSNPAPEGTP
jgi:predicted Zn finger-like uncharacterized protein